MRSLTMSVAVVAVTALLPVSAAGHGGEYRHGPAAEVPPDSREPSDPPPPPEGPAPDPCRGTEWSDGARWFGPSDAIRSRVARTLLTLLCDETAHAKLRAAAAIALARIDDRGVVGDLERRLLDQKRGESQEVRRAAALGLGLATGDPDATLDLLIQFVGASDPADAATRPFAALALGLRGDSDGLAAAALLDVVARDDPRPEMRPACLIALGLVGDESTVGDLATFARTGRTTASRAPWLDDTEVACAVAALGMIGSPGEGDVAIDVVEEIVRGYGQRGPETRAAAAIALGPIGARCERVARRRAADLLIGLAEDGAAGDRERMFALTSLGRIGAAPGHPQTRNKIVGYLRGLLRSDGERAPAYAAFALSRVDRAVCDEGGRVPERDIRVPLRDAFADERDVAKRRAFAFASALAGDLRADSAFVGVLGDASADAGLRGACALAAGMLGDFRADQTIRAVLRDPPSCESRVACATALGLLGETSDAGELLSVLRSPASALRDIDAAALAFARISGPGAADGLLEIALDADAPSAARVAAISALGRLAARRDVFSIPRLRDKLDQLPGVPPVAAMLALR